jgi:hypothetical protein
MATSCYWFESELIIIAINKVAEAINDAMLKKFGYNGTVGSATKIIYMHAVNALLLAVPAWCLN